jgi:hypothetical protein
MLLKSNQIELIKYIAILLMFLDHYATINYDSFHIFKILGRIVFPLFAFILVYNYIHNSSDKKKYITRLFIFAIISEPFHYYAFNEFFNLKIMLNIFFSLGLGLLIIYLNEKIYTKFNNIYKNIIFNCFLFIVLFIPVFFFFSYSIFGILMIISLYFLIKNNYSYIYLFLASLTIYFLNFQWEPFLSMISLISLILIFIISKININIKRINKWIFYIFYPLHLLILKFI